MAITTEMRTQVSQLYVALFGRAPDSEGLGYWTQQMGAGTSMVAIANTMYATEPARAYYPTWMTNQEIIGSFYLNVLGRTADTEGLNFWTAKLNAAGATFGSVITEMIHVVANYAGTNADGIASAALFNNRVEVAQYYGEHGGNIVNASAAIAGVTADPASVAAAIAMIGDGSVAQELTVGIDKLSGNKFDAQPAYTPGGTDFVNTLQDEDELTGTGTNPTLNVTLGSVNDNAESMVTPILNNIQTVNVQVTAGSDNPSGINFQDADGMTTLNVNRITATNSNVWMEDLDATVENLGVSGATRGGSLHLHYREDVLTAHDDTVNLTLDNVRLSYLDIYEGYDSNEDAGYGFETANIVVNGTTNLDEFWIDGNYEEDSDGVDQTVNFDVNADLEINDLYLPTADYINIDAGAHVMIGEDEDDILSSYNDGIDTPDLVRMVVTGNSLVEIDGLDGRNSGYTFDASALHAAVHLGMEESADGVVAISGEGDDWIYAYSTFGADVTTNEGDDEVVVYYDQENTSQIDTGDGNDYVSIGGDMLADSDVLSTSNELGDVEHASIDTGAGDDTVSVGNLDSARDWDHNVLNDGNADDLWNMAAATISTGDGNDTVSARYLAENAIIDTGAGDDEVTINADTGSLSGGIVLGEDTDDAREVTLDGEVDTLGAVIDLGSGDDILTFNNHSGGNYDVLLVGNRAEVRGGAGTDEMNVNFVDSTYVVYEASEGDDDDFITGIETINLTAMNAVDYQTSLLTGKAVNEQPNYADTVQPTAYLDVARVDTDLETINLVSEEQPLLANPQEELYEPGTETGFDLDNLRADITVNLTAYESGTSQGDSNDGAIFLANEIINDLDERYDVELRVDFEDATAQDDTFTLNVTAESTEFDLDLMVENDGDNISGSGTDSDNEIENVVLNFADAGSHRINMNGFGDDQHSEDQDDVFTSLTINSEAGAGEVFTVTNVTANDISIVVDADVRLALDAVLNDWNYDQFDLSMDYDMNTSGYYFNTYNIQTGAGNDWVDMTTDMVDGDDTVDLGGGRNELVIANDVIIDDVLNSDEIFENIRGVQILTLAGDTWNSVHENAGTFGSNGEIDIALMDDALATGIDTIQLVALEDENGRNNDAEVNLLIDTEFTRDLTINIDSRVSGAELSIDNVAGVDLNINAAVADDVTTVIYFEDAGLPSATNADSGGNVDLSFELIDSGEYFIADGGADVDLYNAGTDYAQINSITLTSSAAVNGVNLARIDISDDWNDGGTLTIDASGINVVSDAAGATMWWEWDRNGGVIIDGVDQGSEDDAVFNITGSGNDDWIYIWGTTDVGDVVDGGAGDDGIQAGIGNDILTGGAGSDIFIFEDTGATNGIDTITDFTTGMTGDVLDFTNFFVGASDEAYTNGSDYGNTFDMWAADGAVANANNDVLYVATSSIGNVVADDLIIGVDNGSSSANTDDIAHMFQTTLQTGNNYLALGDDAKCVVIYGDHNGSSQAVQVFLVDDTLDGVTGYVDSTDVFLVATVNATDLDNFLAYNFGSDTVL